MYGSEEDLTIQASCLAVHVKASLLMTVSSDYTEASSTYEQFQDVSGEQKVLASALST